MCKGPLLVGSALSVGGKDVEVESMLSKADYLAGRPFLGNVKEPLPTLKGSNQTERISEKAQRKHDQSVEAHKKVIHSVVSSTQASNLSFKAPLLNNTVQTTKKNSVVAVPRHDPGAKGALIMKRPNKVPHGKQIVDVVVDPLLTRNLREHQRAGVSFLYECIMGMKGYDGEGAILADEMGLGKTLQTIALLWTLLKQNPVHEEAPIIRKALIVCPVSLINNWRKEFRKWLGKERIGVFVAENNKTRLTDFTHGRSYSVMLVGYEKLRTMQAELQKGDGIDIVIADEGHRLKSAQNKAAAAIKSLNTERRIILSGTPIQNDLAEFYTMVDFVNPGLLNKYSTFKREFETPILKSQQPGASAKDLEKGEARSEELASITSMFILRRTAEILSKYLPAKTEYVLFCKPTRAQIAVYRAIIESPVYNAALGEPTICLGLINVLKKVCNGPNLLLKKNEKGENVTKAELLDTIPSSLLKSPGASGKLQVLDSLLHQIRTTTDEKVVLVSNYTSTMDILAGLLTSLSYKYLRLDGSTPANQRQDLVDRFNRCSPSNSFVFLLSAKAGGFGLNLIGASRLVLFDLDWNPATDLQAMARVHRDGQKRPCYIYRLLIQGALDEKIFQRQVSKTGLADSIVDGKSGTSGFTREELRDLFTLDESPECQTHKLLSCGCGGNGMPSAGTGYEDVDSPRNDLAALSTSTSGDLLGFRDGIEVVHLDDDDDEKLPAFVGGMLKSAKDYDWKAEEDSLCGKTKERRDPTGKIKMLNLMQYAHFDTSLIDDMLPEERCEDEADEASTIIRSDPLEGVIEDTILRSILREDGRRIGFVLSKLST